MTGKEALEIGNAFAGKWVSVKLEKKKTKTFRFTSLEAFDIDELVEIWIW